MIQLAHTPTAAARAATARAAAWLWERQDPDGGWRSGTYALLRSGQALTPFVLHALLEVPEGTCPRPPGGVERALEFLRARVGPQGYLGLHDPVVPEYPTYATAFALRCFARAGRGTDRPLIDRLGAALREGQLGSDGAFGIEHVAFGGWGFGVRPRGGTGHMDVCHTRHVLEALRDAQLTEAHLCARAQVFLRCVQRHPADPRPQPPLGQTARRSEIPYDGGFYFSPVVLAASKGGERTTPSGARYMASYATATCDGLLALLTAGVPLTDERVRSARSWLRRHARLDRVDGIPEGGAEDWSASVRFTHLANRAEAWRAVGGPGGWQRSLGEALLDAQECDGSFVNDGGFLMKEDDPILCTALGLVAGVNTTRSVGARAA